MIALYSYISHSVCDVAKMDVQIIVHTRFPEFFCIYGPLAQPRELGRINKSKCQTWLVANMVKTQYYIIDNS
jgi:hypothetical protein